VIGETMVVLLCAGNRIAIPDFSQGLGAVFQPVHTMTGIIAQEMGEVVRGSTHYRALFMVGLVLFTITLGINYLAQKFVARFRMSIG
jgi:phosphate transport system permease protein